MPLVFMVILGIQDILIFGYPPYRIDILTSIDGVDFPDAYLRKNEVVIDDLPITFISRSDLLKNKRTSGRARDLDDLESLPKE